VSRAGAFTQRELTAAFKAAKAAGVRVAYEVHPDGTKRVQTFPIAPAGAPAANDIDAAIEGGRW